MEYCTGGRESSGLTTRAKLCLPPLSMLWGGKRGVRTGGLRASLSRRPRLLGLRWLRPAARRRPGRHRRERPLQVLCARRLPRPYGRTFLFLPRDRAGLRGRSTQQHRCWVSKEPRSSAAPGQALRFSSFRLQYLGCPATVGSVRTRKRREGVLGSPSLIISELCLCTSSLHP